MKKILVPNDFSKYSKRAFLYAKNIAERTGAEIILLHCYHIESNIGVEPSEEELKKFEDITRKNHLNMLSSFLATVSNIHKCKFKFILEQGLPANTIISIVEKENIDFIVMGTKGETNLIEKIFGSVTEKVTNSVKCPILVVPDGDEADNIDSIVFFTSLNQKKDIISDPLVHFSAEIRSSLSCVFVPSSGEKKEYETLISSLQQEIDNGKISGIYSVEIMENEYIEDGISEFIIKHEPDIIAVNIKKKHFVQEIFLSDRRLNLLHEFHIPLLLFKEL